MHDEPPPNSRTTIETVFDLLDNRLVTLGIPGAIIAAGLNAIGSSGLAAGLPYFAGAAGVWLMIKVGKQLSPRIDAWLASGIALGERSLLNTWSALRSDIEGKYLKQQASLCTEFTTDGFNPDRTAIPLLEEVFVPLDLSGALGSGALGEISNSRDLARLRRDAELMSENLEIWDLLRRTKRDRQFRQISIQAKGGMGKTTLLRHIALIYGQQKYRKHRAPRLIPVLLRLRVWGKVLAQDPPPTLPELITQHYIPDLSRNLTPPPQWAEKLLEKGRALVMFDGFDEIPKSQRPQVSHWLSAQMQAYRESVFIITSRPAGFKDYTAQRPAIPIFINKLTPHKQEDFIRRWYLCQERCVRSARQLPQAKQVATARSNHLIAQLRQREAELGYMAENPLLLNMLVTYHRFDPQRELPKQRLELYRGICKLQLDDRPRARNIRMLLPYEQSLTVLQQLAFAMTQKNQATVPKQQVLRFLEQQSVFAQQEVQPAAWLEQILEVSELLVEREPREYEFPHLSFQGFFTATKLAEPQDRPTIQTNAKLVLQNWNGAVWRETVLLYTAQLPPSLLDQVIRKACELGSEAAALANTCVAEYPRSDELSQKLGKDLSELIENLKRVTQNSKYQQLEALLKDAQWRKADEETYRLMITTVGKEEGQYFDREDLENFPCEDLKEIDRLWVHYSHGKWGFSVQKRIWEECGSPMDYNADWEKFGDRVGWRKDGDWLRYSDLTFDLLKSLQGEFPVYGVRLGSGGWVFIWVFS
ncbi:GUN4 domain-containing protein, partial [Thermoleptolyngbya sp. M55_K2018_002]|uniref:GUN4 domain-containing protein n=1 Tax=Thermoleptolyngbya sp. M55_K2018_002 TaxID=2747808 RepID=UPI0019DEB95D